MSYGFTITKDADGLRLNPIHETALAHIPDGAFTVSGHTPAAGTSPCATLSVTLTGPPAGVHGLRQHLASASASYVVQVPAPAEPDQA